MCLVHAMRNHHNDLTIQISAADILEVLVRLDFIRAPAIIATSGGIPTIFDAVNNSSISLHGRNHNAEDPVLQVARLEEVLLTQIFVTLLVKTSTMGCSFHKFGGTGASQQ